MGETRAANFRTSQGYIVLDRNWATTRYGRGELDLVCRRGSDLVVVEVKTGDRFLEGVVFVHRHDVLKAKFLGNL